jgi:signal transduction histidine kinase
MNRRASIDRTSPSPACKDELTGLRAIAELAGDGAFIVDCADRTVPYLSAGAARMLGCSIDELQDQLAHPEQPGALASLAAAVCAILAGADPGRNERELDIIGPGGAELPVQLASIPVADEAGRPALLAIVMRDQSALRAVQAEQKRFANMLNHEFRTPLAVIDGAIQRLEATSTAADDATRQRYRKIGAAVDRLIGMLDEYLSPERMAALGKTRTPAGVDPRTLLEEAAEQARAAGRPVTMYLDQLPASLRGDQQGLRLALKVLIDNALAYTPAAAEIHLSGRRVPNGIELVVRDAGPGVPPLDAPRIFDKSYRGSNATSVAGSGLGLYMARSLLEVHGGTLELADSTGEGATFRVWLPLVNDGKVVAPGEPNSDNRLKEAGERRPDGARHHNDNNGHNP